MTTTSIQDRTPEFFSILAQAKKRQNNTKGPRSSLLSDGQKREANGSASGERRARSEFARNAAQVGRGISATMGKLEKLAQCTHTSSPWSLQKGYLLTLSVAKRKTLFDDRPVEISELTYDLALNSLCHYGAILGQILIVGRFIIKQDLASLNSQISNLQSLTQSLHPSASQPRSADQEGEILRPSKHVSLLPGSSFAPGG